MLKTSIAVAALGLSLTLALPATAQERPADAQAPQCPAGETCTDGQRPSWSLWNWLRGGNEPVAQNGQEPRRRSFSFIFGGQQPEEGRAPEVATKGPEPVVAEGGLPPPVDAGTTKPLDRPQVVTDTSEPRPTDQVVAAKPDAPLVETTSAGKLVTTAARVPAKPDLSKASQRVRFYCPPARR